MRPEVEPFFDPRTQTLTYLAWDPESGDAVAVDPVLDYEPVGAFTWTESLDALTDFIRRRGLRLHHALETHAHADHLSGSQLLGRRFGARVAIGENIRAVQSKFREVFDLGEQFPVDGSQFDQLLADGESLRAGTLEIEVLATPGHTPACVSYRIGDAIFSGDVLFMDDHGTGRCDFPGGSAEAMFDSVSRLYQLPESTRVFVGHDYQPNGRELRWQTTIGESKRKNPQLNQQTAREEFVRFRRQRDAGLGTPKLFFPRVQVNIAAGRLPPAHENGVRYLALPLNFLRRRNELGEPLPQTGPA